MSMGGTVAAARGRVAGRWHHGLVREVEVPASGGRLHRTVAASLAAFLELDVGDVPLPEESHPEPWTVWRTWLLQQAVGLVPIADPATFNWPGPWLALLRAADGDGRVGAVAYGSPPGIAWHPLGGPETLDAVEAGFLVAPADVTLWSRDRESTGRAEGTVEAIVLGPEADGPLQVVEVARAHAGRGLEGDRYFDGRGTFSNVYSRGHDLTLIEAEALDDLDLPGGARLEPADARRNIVTRGVDLNALVGERFRVGETECIGRRLCEPCAHLERRAAAAGKPGTLRALVHKGGLRADLLSDGEIRVGDSVRAV
jgi:hypothetical protein